MFKSIATAAFTLAASASTASAYVSATVADTCTIINFSERANDFTTLNAIVDLLGDGSLLKTFLVGYDPWLISNQTVDDIDFSVLGVDFTLTPTLESLNLTGLTLLRPYHINVTGDHEVAAGAYFDGVVSLDASFSVEIAQDHKWYQLCWTNLLHPIKCPPATFGASVQLAIDLPAVTAGLEGYMYNCKAGIATSACTNVSVSSILTAAITGNVATLLPALEKNLINGTITSFDASFGSVTDIEFTFRDVSSLINQLINALLDYSAEKLNKKKHAYELFMKVFNKVLKSILNSLVTTELKPLFGATCLAQ